VLHQLYKDLCFLLIAKATWPNYWMKKLGYAARSHNGHRLDLHLGCGTKYLPGFVNIDANPLQKTDVWLDVCCGLPFATGSVDSICSTHMIEPFYPDELERLLRVCVRVLKTGGGMRIVVASLANTIVAFQEKRHDWFYDAFPRHFDSLGGRFSNFVFCDGQHRTAFDVRSPAQSRVPGSDRIRRRAEPPLWRNCSGLRTRRCGGTASFGVRGGF